MQLILRIADRHLFRSLGRLANNARHRITLLAAWSVCQLCLTNQATAADSIDFNRDIRPILSAKCFECHGPDEDSREAELRLDLADHETGPLRERDGKWILKAGDPAKSALWHRITSRDEDAVMPPPDSHKEPLTHDEQARIRQWIVEGAAYAEFWAFVPPQLQSLPVLSHKEWGQNRIDAFVQAKHEREHVTPQPRADKRTLIRRLTFDLTGLPPTSSEIRAYLSDNHEDAYEKLVDRLLESPHYGEHMAKYWMDLVRFADTNGIHHDHYREMTPYRDWIIRSFNRNLPYDQFVVDQVAGDLHEEPSIDQLVASGFNRLHLVIDKGTAIPQESFTRNVIDRVTAVGTAFMGLTVGCAVCHDHKYDPITQRDFYQLYAFFNNIESPPETPGRGVHPPFLRLATSEQQQQMQKFDEQVAALENELTKANQSDAKETEVQAIEQRIQQAKSSRKQLEDTIPVTLIMKERDEVRPTHMLIRGVYDQPGEEVQRNTPAFLPPLQPAGEIKSRMDLAHWLVSKEHPLTSRVTVNRFWQQFFGVGLVKTSEDFGTQGEWPSHPQLLDDLAVRFMESGWNVKELVRSIVMSATYQQSSRAPVERFKADPENRLLARGSRFRLDAEMIRDQILAVSGLLSPTMYGKSVKPPQPPDLWKNVSMVSSSTYAFTADTGEKIRRRSLYSFWKRALPPPQMTIFDAPTREACTARRERTNTPLQALVLMNEEQYFHAARHFAITLHREHKNDEQRLNRAYEAITSHLPDDAESHDLQAALDALNYEYAKTPALAEALTKGLQLESDQRTEVAALSMVINSIFNLDVTKTRE